MKKNTRNYRTTTTTELDYIRVIKISVGVIVILLLVYFITAIASGEIKLNNKKEEKEIAIQYQEIIGGEMLNRKANEYYVMVYDFSDDYNEYYQSLINQYIAKDNSLPFYTVDLSKKINEDYKLSADLKERAETIEFNILKVADVALVKVSSGNISETIEGKDKVIEYLQNQ